MVTVLFSTATVALLAVAVALLFGEIESRTVPLPVPLAPLVIVTHEAASVALHEQALWVVTFIETVPPSGLTALVLLGVAV